MEKFFNKNKRIDVFYIRDNIFSVYFNKLYFDNRIKKKYNLDKLDGYINIANYLLENISIRMNYQTIK